jgi:uncharacterized protein (TIGR00369 family)
MSSEEDNETRRAIASAIETGQRDVPLNCNPAFAALEAVLVDGGPGDVLVRFTARQETTQGNGVVGGGTLANMLDSAIAVAVLSVLKPGQTCSTISLTVNMLRPAKPGQLYVRAGVEKLGRRIAFAHGQLLSEDRKPLATASSSLALIDYSAAE